MMSLRRTLPWAGLAFIAALIVLSVTGAFLGPQRAAELFTSVPLAAVWAVLAAATAAGVLLFPKMRRSPGLLFMHLGWALVIVAGLWGSDAGHRLEQRLGRPKKVRQGCMVLFSAEKTGFVFADDLSRVLAELPFAVELKEFRVEYYYDDGQWDLGYNVAADKDKEPAAGKLAWQLDKPVRIPHTDIDLRVHELTKEPGKLPKIAGRRPLRASAVLETTRGERSSTGLLAVEEGSFRSELPLAHLFPDKAAWLAAGSPRIFLAGPPQQPKSYKADVAVITDGREVARKVIEINRPLHYGGYHFYQTDSFDKRACRYTVLSVRSDSGLRAAYAGMALLLAGALWHFYLAPAAKFIRRA
jgi:hypothetical protein